MFSQFKPIVNQTFENPLLTPIVFVRHDKQPFENQSYPLEMMNAGRNTSLTTRKINEDLISTTQWPHPLSSEQQKPSTANEVAKTPYANLEKNSLPKLKLANPVYAAEMRSRSIMVKEPQKLQVRSSGKRTIKMNDSDPAQSADEYTLPKDIDTSGFYQLNTTLPSIVQSETYKANFDTRNLMKPEHQLEDNQMRGASQGMMLITHHSSHKTIPTGNQSKSHTRPESKSQKLTEMIKQAQAEYNDKADVSVDVITDNLSSLQVELLPTAE